VAGPNSASAGPAFLPAGDVVIGFPCRGHDHPHDHQLVTWEPVAARLVRQHVPDSQTYPTGKIAVSPDGRTLASLHNVWDLFPLRLRFDFGGHDNQLTDVAFAPDGRTVATAGLDHIVRIWNVVTGDELLALEGHTGPVRAVLFSPDGRALASAGDGPDSGIEVIVWRSEPSASGASAGPLSQGK
jgi:WD40 repeat protein